jgi:hypothetical protein
MKMKSTPPGFFLTSLGAIVADLWRPGGIL